MCLQVKISMNIGKAVVISRIIDPRNIRVCTIYCKTNISMQNLEYFIQLIFFLGYHQHLLARQ